MGIVTTLTAITPTPAENGSTEAYGADVASLLGAAITKAQELAATLNTLSARLPNGDANIATIQTVIASLS
nr:MAG TPA: hypothetical protein [Caudoviricetes sp.]